MTLANLLRPSNPPDPKFSEDGRPTLQNWEEIDRWARHNVPSWCAVGKRCRVAGITDPFEILKLQATALLQHNDELQKSAIASHDRLIVLRVDPLSNP